MARIEPSVIGTISGKLGDDTYVSRKDGVKYVRKFKKSGNPNTAGQKAQRGKFGFTMKEINYMRPFFTDYYDSQYGINSAISLAMKEAVVTTDDGFWFDYSKFQLTNGPLRAPAPPSFTRSENQNLHLEWITDLSQLDRVNDEVHLVVVDPIEKKIDIQKWIAIREDGCTTVSLAHFNEGAQLHAWFYLFSAKPRRFSNSLYFRIE